MVLVAWRGFFVLGIEIKNKPESFKKGYKCSFFENFFFPFPVKTWYCLRLLYNRWGNSMQGRKLWKRCYWLYREQIFFTLGFALCNASLRFQQSPLGILIWFWKYINSVVTQGQRDSCCVVFLVSSDLTMRGNILKSPLGELEREWVAFQIWCHNFPL